MLRAVEPEGKFQAIGFPSAFPTEILGEIFIPRPLLSIPISDVKFRLSSFIE